VTVDPEDETETVTPLDEQVGWLLLEWHCVIWRLPLHSLRRWNQPSNHCRGYLWSSAAHCVTKNESSLAGQSVHLQLCLHPSWFSPIVQSTTCSEYRRLL